MYRLSPKRVHDSAEVFDGVPSLYDAKAAYQIGRLHLDGVNRRWEERREQRRELAAQIAILKLRRERPQSSTNRLEVQLSRHWAIVPCWWTTSSLLAYCGMTAMIKNGWRCGTIVFTGRTGLRKRRLWHG